jgi:hypothetical protein
MPFPQGVSMNYTQLTAQCRNKFAEYDKNMCARALHDCHVTLQLNSHLPTDDPYYIKLWAEIDAIRDRQAKL